MLSPEQSGQDCTQWTDKKLRLLADINKAAVAYLDRDRYFQLTNAAFDERFGAPEGATRACDFFKGVCSPAVDDYLETTISRAESLNAQLDCGNQCGDTERLRLETIPCEENDSIDGVFLLFDPIETRSVELYEETSGTGEHKRQNHLQRMALIGEMAAGLAHEIRQPLSAIGNYADAIIRMLDNDRPATDVKGLAARMSDQIARADRILTNTRNVIGQGDHAEQSFDLRRIVDDTITFVERRTRELDVDVRLAVASSLPNVQGNPAQIEQILINLATNALDAMQHCDERVLRIDIYMVYDNVVCMRMRDTGIGIDSEQLPSIFEPFSSNKTDGMGMGLALSRALAEQHGGQLRVETDLEQGAGFVLELPVHPDERGTASAASNA
ncbi:ATP-binding protein [Salinisphaera sp. SPP-AMP-43]|uniref:sensor histidine kinase n=1 Tax=Salinisphaera sp. SPP-AMP-43 TaxID=3121288 RepID=UPI003C6E43B5